MRIPTSPYAYAQMVQERENALKDGDLKRAREWEAQIRMSQRGDAEVTWRDRLLYWLFG